MNNTNTNEWIPLTTGIYPEENEVVQVTYLKGPRKKPCCDEFASYENGAWYWNSEPVSIEITAWKKNSEPYMGHVGPITEMTMDLKFDRPIVKGKHYISPGGYAFRSGGKTYQFDFLCFEGRIDPEDPTILHAEVHHLDKDYSYDMSDFNAENLQEIEEFFVYTGEYDDPEIYLESVLSLTIWQGDAEMDIKKELLPVEKSSENIERQMQRQMQKQIQKVGQLEKQLPDGGIMDADTILVDLLEECDFHMSGFAQDIFNIYRNSSDKEAVKQMFYEFTNMEFEDYLKLCLKELDCE